MDSKMITYTLKQVSSNWPLRLRLLFILLTLSICHALAQSHQHENPTSQMKFSETLRSQKEVNVPTNRIFKREEDEHQPDHITVNQPADTSEIESDNGGDGYTGEESYNDNSSGSTSTAIVDAAEDVRSSSIKLVPDYEGEGDSVDPQPAHSAASTEARLEASEEPKLRPQRQYNSLTTTATTLRPNLNSGSPDSITTPLVVEPRTQLPTMMSSVNTVTPISYPRTSQQVTSSADDRLRNSMPVSPTFNVDIGTERMLIKPHQNLHQQQSAISESNILKQDITTDSINHEMPIQSSRSSSGVTTIPTPPINERRLDLLYPLNVEEARMKPNAAFALRAPDTDNQQEAQVSVPNICYTPIALIMVILVTMVITIVVCFCTHLLIRHLGRHQFDLLENNKQFDTKNGSRYLADGGQRRPSISNAGRSLNANHDANNQLGDDKHSCMLNLFQDSGREGNQRLYRLRNEHGCAFDNPYFRDEGNLASSKNHLHLRQQQQQQRQQQYGCADLNYLKQSNTTGLLATSPGLITDKEAPASEQLYFIEHHIANLHNRQVTSSVQELSILASPDTVSQHLAQVVDLTSEEQRAKVIADPKEGDLVAVDISGHDFIGLGFDIFGNSHDGIFVKSVLNRGPARESGCIHPGDRIKCLNISFDSITLNDAFEILNCGSPYKMRLLLEKQAAPAKRSDKLRSAAPIVLRHMPRETNLNSRQQQASTAAGTSGAGRPIKTYLKRLTDLVTPNSNKTSNTLEYQNQFSAPTPGFSSSELHLHEPVYLGSAAARQHLLNGPVLLDVAHVNAGYGSDITDEINDEVVNVTKTTRHRRLSHGDSMDLNVKDRFSTDTVEIFGPSTNEFAPDSSLDYHIRNVNHRLHGPPLLKQRTQMLARDIDLGLTSHDQAAAKLIIGSRCQSVAVSSAALNNHDDQHLEQSQSQPEIALKENYRAVNGRLDFHMNPRIVDGPREGRPERAHMMNSISTPTMNLISSLSQPLDWRRVSSRKRKKEQKKNSIREEPGSDNSFADSTSKLVEGTEPANRVSAPTKKSDDLSSSLEAAITASRSTGSGLVSKTSSALISSNVKETSAVKDKKTDNNYRDTNIDLAEMTQSIKAYNRHDDHD